MTRSVIVRGGAALAFCYIAALASLAAAQTPFYFSGGTANWNDSNLNGPWYNGININVNPHTFTGSPTPWVNDGNGQAYIGYISSAGSGGTNRSSVDSGLTNNESGKTITLSSTSATNAYGVQFSYDSSNGTVQQNGRYLLTGGTINLGPNGFVTDLSATQSGINPYTTFSFGSTVKSDVVAVGGTLNINCIGPNISNGSALFTSSDLYLAGTNSYTTLHVGAATGAQNGTQNSAVIQSPAAAGSFTGDPTGGTGTIQNVILDNNAGLAYMGSNTSTLIVNNVVLNGPATQRSLTYGAYSTTRARIFGGAFGDTGFSQPAMQVGAINGNGDLIFATGANNNGRATLLLTQTSNYTGDTFIQTSSLRNPGGDAYGMPFVTLGVDNALPVGTNLIYGLYQSAGNGGVFDLGGHNQQLASIGTIGINVGTTQNDYFGGVTNSSSGLSTLSLMNSSSNNWVESQFHGVIGRTYMDTTSPRKSVSTSTTDNIALHLVSGNNASLTLGLGNQGSAPPGVPLTEANTYYGGTTIDGGMLFASNGGSYFDGRGNGQTNNGYGLALGATVAGVTSYSTSNAANSATGTGWVLVNSGGTIGGSRLAGAIGMPDSVAYATGARVGGGSLGVGRVTVANSGTLLPGGGYFVDASGAGNGGYVGFGTNFTPTSGPTFHVLGDLALNAGSNLSFNFDAFNTDQIAIGGVLGQTATGTINLNLNNLGTIANGLTLFTFSNSGAIPSDMKAITPASFHLTETGNTNPDWTYSLLENSSSTAITLSITTAGAAVPNNLTWSGGSAGGLWDTAITPNFVLSGSSVVFHAGDITAFDNSGTNKTVTIAAAGVQPSGMIFTNAGSGNAYTVTGGSIGDSAGGQAFVKVTNGGLVTLANSGNTYSGITYLASASTLQANSVSSIGPSSVITIGDNSQLTLNFSSGTLANNIHLNPLAVGPGARPTISVPSGEVVATGQLISDSIGVNAGGLTKTGSGILTLTNAAQSNDIGSTYIAQGMIRVTTTAGTAGQAYTALGSGNMYTGYNGNYTGSGTLWLDNVNVGVRQNVTTGRSLGFWDVYPGSGVKGTGNSSLSFQNPALILSQSAGSSYQSSDDYFTTGGSSDTLTFNNNIQQFDPNSGVGHSWNGFTNGGTSGLVQAAVSNTTTSAFGMQTTIHVSGGGKIVLADGNNTNSNSTFGGAWSVESGVLQVGPFQFNPNYSADTNDSAAFHWNGPTGEALTALGFMTPKGASTTTNGNADAPTTATVKAGGLLAIAVDQINPLDSALQPGAFVNNFNPTPAYLRTGVVLSGGSVAATGYEATFLQQTSGTEAAITSANSPVVARFGGSFTVSSSGGAVLTYEPNGKAKDSLGNTIVSDSGSRTVELVGGTRFLSNLSYGYAAGTTVQFATNWSGNLTVASAGTVGGTFNIKRSVDSHGFSGAITVTPSATITVQPYSTMNISNDDSSLMNVSLAGSIYGQMVSGGTLPVMNYVLSNGGSASGTAVAIANNGAFNVNAGTQAVASISGAGATNVTGTASLFTASISQANASVAGGAALNLTGPGVVASSMALASSGALNVTGGNHTVGTIGTSGTNNVGATTVSGAGTTLSAAQLYQASATASNGGAIVLTAAASGNLSSFNAINVASGKIDTGKSGFFLPTSGSATIFSQVQAGAGHLTWTGSSGVTSSLAAGNTNKYGVGYGTATVGSATQLIVATTLAGDAHMTGSVDASDLALVFGSSSNYGKSGMGWPQGNFHYYDTTIGNLDRQLVKQNFGNSYAPTPVVGGPVAVANGSPAGSVPLSSQMIDYNYQTGELSLLVSASADLDAFSVYMQNPPGSAMSLPKSWETSLASDSIQYGKQDNGSLAETLLPGTYLLANLAPGLSPSAFGTDFNGPGNASGAVLFYDSNYNSTAANVQFVPEPGSVALLMVGSALAGGIVWRKRRSVKSA